MPPEFLNSGEKGGATRCTPGDVSALGVVMLFLVCRLPLLELRKGHPKWWIAEAPEPETKARAAVQKWIANVTRVLNELNATNRLEDATKDVVAITAETRIQVHNFRGEAAEALCRRY